VAVRVAFALTCEIALNQLDADERRMVRVDACIENGDCDAVASKRGRVRPDGLNAAQGR
jgi:hypothetical protein